MIGASLWPGERERYDFWTKMGRDDNLSSVSFRTFLSSFFKFRRRQIIISSFFQNYRLLKKLEDIC